MSQRGLTKPDTSTLIGDQKDAFEKTLKFLESGEQFLTFEGFAGVGKSFCINMLVQHLLTEHSTNICVAAPTHKALNVITHMASFSSDNLSYATIHSVLGLRPEITSEGKEIFVKDKQSKNKLKEFDLLIVDESSMLDDQLFGYLKIECDKNPYLKIIFVGDGFQLPPINHSSSIPMSEDRREHFGIGHIKLTQIVRQKGTNPIIEFSKEIREGIFKPRHMKNEEGHGIYVVSSKDSGYRKVLKKFFCNEKYESNADFCRVTSWTNKSVDDYNIAIRKMIYEYRIRNRMTELKGSPKEEMKEILMEEFPFYRNGSATLPKYIIGDKLIVDKPVFTNDEISPEIIFHTSEELMVEDISFETRIGLGEAYKCYVAKVKNLFDGQHHYIEMIHDDDVIPFEAHKERLRQEALKKKKRSSAARDAWVRFYSLDKRFARLKYAPALTAHKSQGSTYENIIINIPDITRNRKREEMLKMLYVAVTRAQKRAILLV